jgi:hypothetical protein
MEDSDAPNNLGVSGSGQISQVNVPLPTGKSLSRVTRGPSAFGSNSAGEAVEEKWDRNDHITGRVSASHKRLSGQFSGSISSAHTHNAEPESGRTNSRDGAFTTSLVPSESSSNSQRGNYQRHNPYETSAGASSFEQFADQSRPRNLDEVHLEGGEYWHSGYGQIPGIASRPRG